MSPMKKKPRRASGPTKRATPKKKPAKRASKSASTTRPKSKTAARVPSRLVSKSAKKVPPGPVARPAPGNATRKPADEIAPIAPIDKPGGISTEAVQKATGKSWDEWLTVLDAKGAAEMTHQEIATLLYEKHGVPEWWCQMVTVGYEQARGLREKHQTPSGYQVSASKTIAVSVETLFAAWSDEGQRARWLPGAEFTIRKATPPKTMRITWVDGKTSVEVTCYPKGAGKSMVNVQHSKLDGPKDVERMRAHWKSALETLRSALER